MLKNSAINEKGIISHRTTGGKVEYNNDGILLTTAFGLINLKVNWTEINFCSITPAMKKTNEKWLDFKGNKLDKLKFLTLDFALKNRHKIAQTENIWLKFWLKSALNLKPLFGADDKPLPKKGIITIEVQLNSLSITREKFIEFLSKKTKFDLIVHS